MSTIAFPLNDDGLVWDMHQFIDSHHGRVVDAPNPKNGNPPILYVDFHDAQDIAADIQRRKLAHAYRREAA